MAALSPSMDGDRERLCRACGLCCDGSLFGRVPLDADEIEAVRRRLPLVGTPARAFEQPCVALGEDRACAIYAERPRACRRFTCKLYERDAPLAERLAVVARVRALLEHVHTLAAEVRNELTERIEEDFARASSTRAG